MKKIIINPHNCSREELAELKEYLDNKCWDYKEEVPKLEVDTKTEKISRIDEPLGSLEIVLMEICRLLT